MTSSNGNVSKSDGKGENSFLETELLGYLHRIPMCRRLGEEELKALAAHCGLVELAEGQCPFVEGEPSHHLYWLGEGRLKLTKHGGTDRECLVRLLGEPWMLEDLSALESGVHDLTCRALAPSRVLALEAAYFQAEVLPRPGVAAALLERMAAYLRQDYVCRLYAGYPVEVRIARFLIDLTFRESFARRVGGQVDFDLPLTRRDIAEAVGTTVETSIRTLRKWVRNRWIEDREGRLRIRKPEKLAALAEGHPPSTAGKGNTP